MNKRSNSLVWSPKARGNYFSNSGGKGSGNGGRENKVQHIKTIIDKIWDKCIWSGDSPVEDYLKSRGFTSTIPYSIKYHPRLYHSPTQSYYPAMVAIVSRWSDGASLGLHRIYLKHYGNDKDSNGVGKVNRSYQNLRTVTHRSQTPPLAL